MSRRRRIIAAGLPAGIAAFLAILTSPLLHAENVPGSLRQFGSSDEAPGGLPTSDWQSIRAAHTAWEYSVMPVEGRSAVWQARNKSQQWTTHFDRRGFTTTPKSAAWQWGLDLRSYGFGANRITVGGQPEVKTNGGRISYQWDERIEEWFINDERGMEHGFILEQRPAGAPAGVSLDLVLGVRGSLRAGLSADGHTVHFRDKKGAPVVNYGGLKAWDADGKVLPSRFATDTDGAVVLRVDESTARYPITIDPIAQQAYLKRAEASPAYAGAEDYFGHSVAVSGDTVVVGAYGEASSTTGVNSSPNEVAPGTGAAYVFVRNGTVWSQQAYLKASHITANSLTAGDYFGISVAVSGDTVVVGAPREDSSRAGVNSTPDEFAWESGAAFVFVRNGTTWTQQAYLKASRVTEGDEFGASVAVSGNTVVVGAYRDRRSSAPPPVWAAASGAAYAFVRSGTAWSQQADFKASQITAGDWFGASVAVSGDTMVVGAPREDSSTTGSNSTPNEAATDAGAVYVFVRNGTSWSQQAYLKAHQVTADDVFGSSVAVDGETVVVGAPYEDSSTTGVNTTANESAASAGAAYVFVRSATTWSQQAYLKASHVAASDRFGHSVAVSGDTVVVGAPLEDSNTTGVNSTPNRAAGDAGAAFVFVRSGPAWIQQAYLKASHVSISDYFGWSVAVSGDAVVVGAHGEDSRTTGINSTPDEMAKDAGAAYVFERSGTTWGQQAYLKTSGIEGSDSFGWSVAVSGNTVVVGAPAEDSGTTGVNSTPNEWAKDSGAAYVFVRSGTAWIQQAYLKADYVRGPDQYGYITAVHFGWSVAVSGDTIVVGAPKQDHPPSNPWLPDSGAAYVFVRSGTTWSQEALLVADEPAHGAYFGHSVSLSGDTLVAGAYGEDSDTTGVNGVPGGLALDSGAAYVFVRNGTTWSQQAYLKASQVTPLDYFGASVAVSGDTVVVGAYGEDSSTTGINGTPNEAAQAAGAAYVFVRSGTTWSQQAYLKAHEVSAEDYFGWSVSVSGDTVVVGAPGEDSSSTGVNGTTNEARPRAGAAYVFVRSGTTWSQQSFLKASQVSAEDFFGTSVAVNGNTIVAGADGEDGSSTGINSTANETAGNAGAAYVFVRSGTTWGQQAYLKASHVSGLDLFGASVAVSGDTVVVGTPGEDSSTTGVNSTPNETGTDFGAAYIFTGLGPATIPRISLSGNHVDIVNGDTLASTVDYTDFGSANVTSGSVRRTFTISNHGTGALNLTGSPRVALAGSSAFSVSTLPAPATVAADGGTVTFTITYDPAVVDTDDAMVSIASDDSAEDPFTFAISGSGSDLSGIEIWRLHWFGTAANSGNAADSFDFDGDGMVNLIEWACKLDPTTNSTLPASVLRNGATLEFTYTRNVAAVDAGVSFAVEWSDILADPWTSSDVPVQILSDDGAVQVAKATVPVDTSARRFVRLKITAPP